MMAATKYLFYTMSPIMDPIDAHFLALGLLVAIQITVLFFFAKTYLTPSAAMVAVACMLTHPRYWADLHNNQKDIPESVMFTVVIVLFHLAITERKASLLWLTSIMWGAALATKGNAIFLPLIVGPWWLAVVYGRWRRRESVIDWRMGVALIASPIVAAASCLIFWPYLLMNFPRNITRHIDHVIGRGSTGPDHWQIEPLIKLLTTTPVPVLVLVLIGLMVMAVRLVRRHEHRTQYVLVLLWMLVPIIRVSMPKASDFDGIRHWIEFVPAMGLVAGVGVDFVVTSICRIRAIETGLLVRVGALREVLAIVILVVTLSPAVCWMVENHPYEIVFFNRFVGGLGGAQQRGWPEANDYWGSSYRQGLRWLNQHAEANALLFVGMGEHIVEAVQKNWLRKDIEFRKVDRFSATYRENETNRRPIYFMVIPRRELYNELARSVPDNAKPVYEVRVDGGLVFRIVRLDGMFMVR
jgi:hypothetical protein